MIYDGVFGRLDDLGESVTRTEQDLTRYHNRFDVIVVSGVSGIVVGAPVALALGIPLVVVRKEEDKNGHHMGGEIINVQALLGKRYLIVDDFVCSGRTVEYIKRKIDCHPRHAINPPEYAGVYEYSEGDFRWEPRKP